ncbi:hypothetical protein BLA29_000972 [Euroglyphus maynei]|uniref:Uncharacterized protein n=1 Tax=Euroglyphus maynei TaxID=6958 RepID=A0A1Y3BE62_EURMA|nr:hypothetical protein BLA29_000972 [Euroglyphus maynei]
MILITIFIAIFGPNICIGSITNESLNNQKELTILNIGNEINQLLSGVSSVCRESIVPGERECYMRYLDRYADLSRQVINEDISSEFDRKVL